MRLAADTRFALILGVVALHSFHPAPGLPQPAAGIIEWFTANVLTVCVPTFYCLSGYMFFRDREFTLRLYGARLRRRVRTLLVPYLLWNTLGLLLALVKMSPAMAGRFPQYAGMRPDMWTLLAGYWDFAGTYPYDFVLWFVRDLMAVMLLAWAPGAGLRRIGLWTLPAALAAATALSGTAAYGIPAAFFYFTAGAAAAWHGQSLAGISRRPAAWAALAAVALWTLRRFLPAGMCQAALTMLCNVCGAVVAMALTRLATRRFSPAARWRGLAALTFFIYAMHGLYVTVANRLVGHLIPPADNLAVAAGYAVTFALLASTSAAAALATRRLAPRLYRMLTGTR